MVSRIKNVIVTLYFFPLKESLEIFIQVLVLQFNIDSDKQLIQRKAPKMRSGIGTISWEDKLKELRTFSWKNYDSSET